jgi:hypothetical protein
MGKRTQQVAKFHHQKTKHLRWEKNKQEHMLDMVNMNVLPL